MQARQRVDALPPATLPQGRISPRLKQAIQLIVETGCTLTDAAKTTGYTVQSLHLALKRPHVQALKRDMIRNFMQNGTDLARWTLIDLCRNSKSDDVRHKSARTLLELAGEIGGQSSDTKGEIGAVHVHIHRAGRQPNQLSQLNDDDMETITIQAVRPDPVNIVDVEPVRLDPPPSE